MKTPRPLLLVLLLILVLDRPARAANEPVVPLWPAAGGEVPPEKVRITEQGEHVVSSVHQPSLTVYLPAPGTATGAAVVVCPGGGHRELWMDHEGYAVARWLADHGIAAFILKYRLARETGSTYRVDVESLADAQRALRTVRSRATEWGVDPARVGIMGFSAGGELAALAAARGEDGKPDAAEPLDRLSSRVAFQGLVYPGNAKAIQPTKDSPPAFLLCGYDDRPDISQGLAEVFLRFKQAGVPAELHIYTGVGHGFGLRATNKLPVAEWPARLREWLGERGFLAAAKAAK
jgi:endo-1,4-beta-xylanase